MNGFSLFSAKRNDKLSPLFWADSLIKSLSDFGGSREDAHVDVEQNEELATSHSDRKRVHSLVSSVEPPTSMTSVAPSGSRCAFDTSFQLEVSSPPVTDVALESQSSRTEFNNVLSVSGDLFEGKLGAVVVDVSLGDNVSMVNDAAAFSTALSEIDRGSVCDVKKLASSISVVLLVGGDAMYVLKQGDNISITFLAKLLSSEATKVMLNARPLYQLLLRFLGTDKVNVNNLVDVTVWTQVVKRIKGPVLGEMENFDVEEITAKLPENVKAQVKTRASCLMPAGKHEVNALSDQTPPSSNSGPSTLGMSSLSSGCSVTNSQLEDRLCSLIAVQEYYESFLKSIETGRGLGDSSITSLPFLCRLETAVTFLCEVMSYHGVVVRKSVFEAIIQDIEKQNNEISVYAKSLIEEKRWCAGIAAEFDLKTATAETIVKCLREYFGFNVSNTGNYQKQLESFCQAPSRGNDLGQKIAHAWLAVQERAAFAKTLYTTIESMNILSRVFDVAVPPCPSSENGSSNTASLDNASDKLETVKKAAYYSVHPHWAVHHVTTSRLYCSRPNLQTIPKLPQRCTYRNPMFPNHAELLTNSTLTMRHLYSSAPGCVLLSFDFNQIELRVLAHLSGDELLIKQLSSQYDVLSAMARPVVGIPEEEEVPSHIREVMKIIVYGLMYGMGEGRMKEQISSLMRSNTVDSPTLERVGAEGLMMAFHQRYKTAIKFLSHTRIRAYHDSCCDTLTGPSDLSSEKDGNRRKQASVARALQGSAAAILHHSMVTVHEKRHHIVPELPVAPFALIMCVHDELIYSVAEGYVNVVAEKVRQILVGQAHVLSLRVPLDVTVKSGKTLGSLVKFNFS